MTEEEKREHALRIVTEILEDADFSYVYEDEELEDASDDDLRYIHWLIREEVRVSLND